MSSPSTSSSGPDISQIEVWEDPKSRSYSWPKRYTLLFHATGSPDPALIAAAVDSYISTKGIPVIYDIANKNVDAVVADDANDAFCAWNCTWEYSPPETQTPSGDFAEARISFATGGGTMHLTRSLATVSSQGGMNFEQLINVTDNGVNGVDLVAPQAKFSFTASKSWSAVMGDYGKSLVALTGTINNATFKGYGIKEVLFLGASGSAPRANAPFTMTYEFAYSPKKTGIAIGSFTGITKDGWDYLWHFDKKATKTTGTGISYIAMEPVAVFVEQVYELTNFSTLGI